MGGNRLFANLGALAFGSALLSLIVLAGVHALVLRPPFTGLDDQALPTLHSWSTVGLTRLALLVTQLGTDWWALIVALIGAAWKWRRSSRRDGPLLLVTVIGAELLDQAFKRVFQRPRPSVPWTLEHQASFSFPSSHAMVSTVLYGLLACMICQSALGRGHTGVRLAAVLTSAALVLAIGISRVYLGVHYATDVVAGFAGGGIWLATAIWAGTVIRSFGCAADPELPSPIDGQGRRVYP